MVVSRFVVKLIVFVILLAKYTPKYFFALTGSEQTANGLGPKATLNKEHAQLVVVGSIVGVALGSIVGSIVGE